MRAQRKRKEGRKEGGGQRDSMRAVFEKKEVVMGEIGNK